MYYHRHKAVVKDWFGNGLSSPVDGKVEFIQETEFSSSSIQMDLTGLNGQAGKYGIYSVRRIYLSRSSRVILLVTIKFSSYRHPSKLTCSFLARNLLWALLITHSIRQSEQMSRLEHRISIQLVI